MKPAACVTALACAVTFCAARGGLAQDREVNISGKEIVERLSRIEEAQKNINQRLGGLESRMDGLERRIDGLGARIDGLGARIDGLGARINDVQKGVEQKIDQRIGELRDFMLWGFGVTFAGMFALVGFVLWDRRTALAPAVRRIEELQDREQRLESALRDYALGKSDLASSLRKSGLL